MPTVSDLEITDKLHASSNSIVYRVRHTLTGRPAVIKMLEAYPSPERIAWFRREYDVTKSLAGLPGVIGVHGLRTEQNRWFIELEDFGGVALSRILAERRLDRAEVCDIAISITRTLGAVHEEGVVHKDINPANLIYNPTTRELKLIDFGISSRLSREHAGLRAPSKLEGTLAYIAPEQTGRMNRSVDARADFYSLGATLYELLTGQLPFPTTDPLETVHAHIARIPVPPVELDSAVGEAFSRIVMKLLEKNAEDRYQSAAGLLRDLEQLRRRHAEGITSAFPLGTSDFSGRLQIPHKLYGREAETEALLAAFDRVATNGSELMLVAGYSGIGKSALIRQIHRPITARRGHYISGKFDQLHRDVPYAPLVEAFRGLVLQILSESAEVVAAWKQELSNALGSNGGMLVDVIPEVAAILGPQPPVPTLDPQKEQNRFRMVFQEFVKVFARREHPLVLFVDDLQWVDSGSLDLCEALMMDGGSSHLFLVGAYRDNEVTDAHPLALRIARMRAAGVPIQHISLEPLAEDHVAELVLDMFGRRAPDTTGLARLVNAKTQGNPFFVIEFLKHLYAERLLVFDTAKSIWRYRLEDIEAHDATDNVVELLAGRVQSSSERTREMLMLAACFGASFDLRTLASVAERTPKDVAADLWDAVAAGLLLTVGDGYKLANTDVEGLFDAVEITYRFAHDRVQQAAYSLLEADARRRLHYRIGKLLWSSGDTEQLGPRLFDVAGQFVHGIDLVVERRERDALARLYLLAGRKAKASAAYGPALSYLQVGIRLLGASGQDRDEIDMREAWGRQYRLCLDLFDEAAEAACLIGQYDEMEQLVEVTRAHATSALDKVRSSKADIQRYSAQLRLPEGVRAGLVALSHLDVDIPDQPSNEEIERVAGEVAQTWMGRDIESLVDLPEMTDPTKIAALDIMTMFYIPAFSSAPGVWRLVVLYEVMFSIQYGVNRFSPRPLTAYGIILCSKGMVDEAYRFGVLALDVSDRFGGADKASVIYMFNGYIRHWRDSIHDTIESFTSGYQLALDAGDLEFAALNLLGVTKQSFWAGVELPQLATQAAEYGQGLRRLGQEVPQEMHDLFHQATLNLLGESADPCTLTGSIMDEADSLRRYTEAHSVSMLASFHLKKLILHYTFGNVDRALVHAAEVEKNIAGIIGMMTIAVYHFYNALALLASVPSLGEAERAAAIERADGELAKLRGWAERGPDNFEHKALLVAAERARVAGSVAEARDLYDHAIASAHEHRFLQDEALAYELCARFHAEVSRAHVARLYLREAHYAYERWGAGAKVRDLEERHPEQLGRVHRPSEGARSQATAVTTTTTTTTTSEQTASVLDLASVLKASLAISTELDLDRLLSTVMRASLENAGAERGYLVLVRDERLVVKARGEMGDEARFELVSVALQDQEGLSKSVVQYVAHTAEPVLLEHAAEEGRFTADPHVSTTRVKSLLCVPILNQGRMVAVTYLENNRATSVFSKDRLDVLKLLMGQAAISIENALLRKGEAGGVFHVGGTVPVDSPVYVRRRADDLLATNVRRGELCYVFDARQKGKSSLRVRTADRLARAGTACVSIDLSAIGSQHVTAEQWYAGFARALVSGLGLQRDLDVRRFWRERSDVSPVQRLDALVDEEILVRMGQPIAIFIDEVDSVIGLDFSLDDFFALLRLFYNRRAEDSRYRRLAIALFGVATPGDLVRDSRRTPFNIGRPIQLTGFRLDEARHSFVPGLASVGDGEKLLKAVLSWSGGQPFLTQKLCQLIAEEESRSPTGREREWVSNLVRSCVVDNWRHQDEPEHLKTIETRLLQAPETGEVLQLYRRILEHREIVSSGSLLETTLLLSGLVTKTFDKLRVGNPIYEAVFDEGWIGEALAIVGRSGPS